MKKVFLFISLVLAAVSFFYLIFSDQSWQGNRDLNEVFLGIIPFLYLILFPFLLSFFRKENKKIQSV